MKTKKIEYQEDTSQIKKIKLHISPLQYYKTLQVPYFETIRTISYVRKINYFLLMSKYQGVLFYVDNDKAFNDIY